MSPHDGMLTNIKNRNIIFGGPEIGDVRVIYDGIYTGMM
jgi:hypothetical protein